MYSMCRTDICSKLFCVEILGLRVSNATFNALVMRYSDKEGHIAFDDFVAAYIKLKSLFGLSSVNICLFVPP